MSEPAQARMLTGDERRLLGPPCSPPSRPTAGRSAITASAISGSYPSMARGAAADERRRARRRTRLVGRRPVRSTSRPAGRGARSVAGAGRWRRPAPSHHGDRTGTASQRLPRRPAAWSSRPSARNADLMLLDLLTTPQETLLPASTPRAPPGPPTGGSLVFAPRASEAGSISGSSPSGRPGRGTASAADRSAGVGGTSRGFTRRTMGRLLPCRVRSAGHLDRAGRRRSADAVHRRPGRRHPSCVVSRTGPGSRSPRSVAEPRGSGWRRSPTDRPAGAPRRVTTRVPPSTRRPPGRPTASGSPTSASRQTLRRTSGSWTSSGSGTSRMLATEGRPTASSGSRARGRST